MNALAAKIVAEAQLANVNVGPRAEVIAARKAELERAQRSGRAQRKSRQPGRRDAGQDRQSGNTGQERAGASIDPRCDIGAVLRGQAGGGVKKVRTPLDPNRRQCFT